MIIIHYRLLYVYITRLKLLPITNTELSYYKANLCIDSHQECAKQDTKHTKSSPWSA